MKHRLRLSLTISLVIITLVAFAYYISGHSYLIKKLAHTPPSTIIWVLLLYGIWFGSLCLIMIATIRICKRSLSVKENTLLNTYSSLVNFFIPGQGGIVVRGFYLKKAKDLAVRNYIFISLMYFMFYAIISTFFLFLFDQAWWKTIGAVFLTVCVSIGVLYLYKRKSRSKAMDLALTPTNLLYLFLVTLFQSIVQIAIYTVELHSVNSNIAIHQVVTYTGAANFALFVALTPGAIGIRESFLLLSRKLHGISSANIISANVIDRSVFIVFLGILFLLTIAFHAKYKNIMSLSKQAEKKDKPTEILAED